MSLDDRTSKVNPLRSTKARQASTQKGPWKDHRKKQRSHTEAQGVTQARGLYSKEPTGREAAAEAAPTSGLGRLVKQLELDTRTLKVTSLRWQQVSAAAFAALRLSRRFDSTTCRPLWPICYQAIFHFPRHCRKTLINCKEHFK
jgi:hypothetical protein